MMMMMMKHKLQIVKIFFVPESCEVTQFSLGWNRQTDFIFSAKVDCVHLNPKILTKTCTKNQQTVYI